MLTFVLSSHSLEIPDDASMLLNPKSDGCSLLSQWYCKLIGWHWIIVRRKFYTLKCAIVVKFTSLVVCGHIMIASNYWLLQLWMMVKYNLTVFLTYIHLWNMTQLLSNTLQEYPIRIWYHFWCGQFRTWKPQPQKTREPKTKKQMFRTR